MILIFLGALRESKYRVCEKCFQKGSFERKGIPFERLFHRHNISDTKTTRIHHLNIKVFGWGGSYPFFKALLRASILSNSFFVKPKL